MLAVLMFIPFGVVVGLVSAVFVKAIYWGEDIFEWMPGNYYSRHSLGMLGQGIIIYLMMIYADHCKPSHHLPARIRSSFRAENEALHCAQTTCRVSATRRSRTSSPGRRTPPTT